MDPVMLARIQFASTTIFHFIFVPLSIGLAFLIAIMETMYVVKGQEVYKKMAKFWGKLFLINFAVRGCDRDSAGIPVRHELVGLLKVCRRRIWRTACH